MTLWPSYRYVCVYVNLLPYEGVASLVIAFYAIYHFLSLAWLTIVVSRF